MMKELDFEHWVGFGYQVCRERTVGQEKQAVQCYSLNEKLGVTEQRQRRDSVLESFYVVLRMDLFSRQQKAIDMF